MAVEDFYVSNMFCFSYYENMAFLVIKEYIPRTVRSYCGVITDIIFMRTIFFGRICDDLFIFVVE